MRSKILLASAVALIAVGGLLMARSGGPLRLSAGRIETMVTFGDRFTPDALSVDAGGTVEIDVRNDDGYAHTFSVDELDVNTYLGPQAERRVTLRIPAELAGRTLHLYCAITGHGAMVGSIEVGS